MPKMTVSSRLQEPIHMEQGRDVLAIDMGVETRCWA